MKYKIENEDTLPAKTIIDFLKFKGQLKIKSGKLREQFAERVKLKRKQTQASIKFLTPSKLLTRLLVLFAQITAVNN